MGNVWKCVESELPPVDTKVLVKGSIFDVRGLYFSCHAVASRCRESFLGEISFEWVPDGIASSEDGGGYVYLDFEPEYWTEIPE